MTIGRNFSPIAVIAALVAVLVLTLAAVLFLSTGEDDTQRLATFLLLASTVITALVGLLKSDQAANSLNGELDRRIKAAVLQANLARRQSDVTPPEATPSGTEIAENVSTLDNADFGG